MALDVNSFTAPVGELRGDMFPGDALNTNISAWLSEAVNTKAPDNESAQIAWTYYRAWTDVANRLATNPSSVKIEGEGETRILVSQISYAQGRADYWRAEYESLVGASVSQRTFKVMRSLQ